PDHRRERSRLPQRGDGVLAVRGRWGFVPNQHRCGFAITSASRSARIAHEHPGEPGVMGLGRKNPDGAPLPTLRTVLARGHFRLVVLAVLLAAVSLTVTGALLLRSYAQQNLQLAAKTLSYAVEPAVYFGDIEAVHEAIRSVGAHNTIRRIEVSGKSDGLLVSWEPESSRPDSALE